MLYKEKEAAGLPNRTKGLILPFMISCLLLLLFLCFTFLTQYITYSRICRRVTVSLSVTGYVLILVVCDVGACFVRFPYACDYMSVDY